MSWSASCARKTPPPRRGSRRRMRSSIAAGARPPNPLQNGDDGALELIHRIERVIDHTAESIKSLEGFRIAWIDEAQTLSVRSLSLLPPTIRAEASELWASWNGLQLRLMRAMESRARNNGWNCVVSDTTDNVVSANNFIRAGYRLYRPQDPWAWPNTLYWRKVLS
jgi:hypothetical protein